MCYSMLTVLSTASLCTEVCLLVGVSCMCVLQHADGDINSQSMYRGLSVAWGELHVCVTAC